MSIRKQLQDSDWEDLGGGWWMNKHINGGEKRFSFDDAVEAELLRREGELVKSRRLAEERAQYLQDVRIAIDATQCGYDELPKVVRSRIENRKGMNVETDQVAIASDVRQWAEERCREAQEKVRLICDNCQRVCVVPIEATAVQCACGASVPVLPKAIRDWCSAFAERADHMLAVDPTQLKSRVDHAHERITQLHDALEEFKKPEELPLKLRRIRSLEVDAAAHEQALGHLTNVVRMLKDWYTRETGCNAEPLDESFLNERYKL